MHILAPKHIKLSSEEMKKLFEKYQCSASQLPKIKATDPSLPLGCVRGDIVRIDRMHEGKPKLYFRVVI